MNGNMQNEKHEAKISRLEAHQEKARDMAEHDLVLGHRGGLVAQNFAKHCPLDSARTVLRASLTDNRVNTS